MKSVTLHNGKTVNLPTTGRDWQLYSSMKCGTAAKSLTAALTKVIRVIDQNARKGYAPTTEGAYKLVRENIHPVMSKYSQYGAYDTEPRCVAESAIEKAVALATGAQIYL